jgi:hypothetical protein
VVSPHFFSFAGLRKVSHGTPKCVCVTNAHSVTTKVNGLIIETSRCSFLCYVRLQVNNLLGAAACSCIGDSIAREISPSFRRLPLLLVLIH